MKRLPFRPRPLIPLKAITFWTDNAAEKEARRAIIVRLDNRIDSVTASAAAGAAFPDDS